MRVTHALVQVAMAIMADPDARQWGYDLTQSAGVRSGVLYPILRRMLNEEWLEDGWENEEEAIGRPPRRYYTLTEKGKFELGAVLRAARNDTRFHNLNFGLAQ